MTIRNRFNPTVACCLGDSISDYRYFSPNMYPGKLGQYMPGVTAMSCGVAGNKSTDILTYRLTSQGIKTYNYFLGPTDPGATYALGQICFVLIGVNDLLFAQPSAATLWTNLQSIYTQVKAYGMQVRPMTITPYGSNSVNQVTILGTSSITGGTFSLAYGSSSTAALAYNASNATVQAAVGALTGIGGTANVAISGGPLPGSNVTMTLSGSAIPQNSLWSITQNLIGNQFTLDVGWNAASEAVRASVNSSIRGSGYRYVDLEGMGDRNGTQPKMLAQFDSGDGLHPNALGGAQMALLAALS